MRTVPISTPLTLDHYGRLAYLRSAVTELRRAASALVPRLAGRKVWMVNSTPTGGGVAEMLPRMVAILRELGVDTEWAVLETDNADFFALTKQLHNLIHGAGTPELPAGAREVYERVNRENAAWLGERLGPRDVLVVHDPQPMALGAELAQAHGVRAIWRCHIGLEQHTAATRTAWEFLRPYAAAYERAVFTASEYVPTYFADRASIITPALDPLSHKNRGLRPHKLIGILSNAGLLRSDDPVLTPAWAEQAQRLAPDGAWGPAVNGESLGLLYRPEVTQISRWDRLKGFAPLMEAFVRWKTRPADGDDSQHVRRRDHARLILAGPDPSSVADDPEGQEVLGELSRAYAALDAEMQEAVAILALPMGSAKQNALMVNALQSSSSLVVQNSLQEGFGLTVAEAMWKKVPVLASSAVGPRKQIESGRHGHLVADPEDTGALAEAIDEMMRDPLRSHAMGEAAHLRVYEEFLVFDQIQGWLDTLVRLVEGHGADAQAPFLPSSRDADRGSARREA